MSISSRGIELLLLVGSLGLFLPGRAVAGGALGLFGGLTDSSLSGDVPERFKYDSLLGGAVGAVAEVNLAEDVRLSFQPMFVQKGAALRVTLPGETARRDRLDLRANYLALPSW